MYAQALVGMVALTGQHWLDERKPRREEVAAHLVNLAWNGLSGLDPKPRLTTDRKADQAEREPAQEQREPGHQELEAQTAAPADERVAVTTELSDPHP
jgi:hypothetical protein